MLFCIAMSIAVFFSTGLLHAKEIPPDEVSVSTPTYEPGKAGFDPKLGQYSYEASWNGIAAGTVTLTLARRGNNYHIAASAKTASFIDIFYKLRFRTEAVLAARTFQPKRSMYVTRANSREKTTQMAFSPDGKISSVRESRGNIQAYHFKPDNFTLDPFSAAFLALSLEWEVGQTRQFDTFNGKSRYLIELTAVEKTRITVRGVAREAIVISPSVTNLTDSDPSDKLHEAKIYIATDRSREILRLVSDLFIGSIKTSMVSYTAAVSEKPDKAALAAAPAAAQGQWEMLGVPAFFTVGRNALSRWCEQGLLKLSPLSPDLEKMKFGFKNRALVPDF